MSNIIFSENQYKSFKVSSVVAVVTDASVGLTELFSTSMLLLIYGGKQYHMSITSENVPLGNVRTDNRLRMCTVWSGPSLSIWRIHGYQRMSQSSANDILQMTSCNSAHAI